MKFQKQQNQVTRNCYFNIQTLRSLSKRNSTINQQTEATESYYGGRSQLGGRSSSNSRANIVTIKLKKEYNRQRSELRPRNNPNKSNTIDMDSTYQNKCLHLPSINSTYFEKCKGNAKLKLTTIRNILGNVHRLPSSKRPSLATYEAIQRLNTIPKSRIKIVKRNTNTITPPQQHPRIVRGNTLRNERNFSGFDSNASTNNPERMSRRSSDAERLSTEG